jgi:C-terminal peptidase prc
MERGQRITKINDKSMAGATPATLRDALKTPLGNFGHEIEVTTSDDDFPTANYRLPTPIPTVYAADMLKDGIGYIRIGNFRESTPRELDEAIEALKLRGLRALILDIRGNPGGSLTSCLAVAQRFLPAGIIVTTQGQTPEFANRVFSSDSGMAATDIPLVLLVDTKTMSAAEIFAGSMKDNARATLVGLPTFGKGLIQAPIRLQSLDKDDAPNKSGFLLLSVGSAYSPRGTPINNVGVTPHVTQADHHKQLIEAINKAFEMLNGVPVEMR